MVFLSVNNSKKSYPKTIQFFSVVAACFGGIALGMHYGWTSPITPILKKQNEGELDEFVITLIETLYMIGGLISLPITAYVCDRFGRKNAILISATVNLIAWVLIAIASHTSFALIYVARFLCGVAGDMGFVSGPMYIGEMSDKSIRGFLTGMFFIAWLAGIVVVYSVAPFVNILTSSCVGIGIVLFQFATFTFLPETPYYLWLRDRKEKCKKALRFFKHSNDIDEDLQEIALAVERQEKEKGRIKDLFIDAGNRRALIVMTVLNASQHMGCISVMLMNLHTILEDAQGIISSETSAITFAVVMLVSATITIATVDKFGRKALMIYSSTLTCISLIILATYFAYKENGGDISEIRWVPIFAVILYAVVFKGGMGMVPIVMSGELFPTSVKEMGMAVSDTVYVVSGAASIYIYQGLVIAVGIYLPMYLFAVCCFATLIFSIFWVPETRGKTLEEIQFILKGIPLEEMKKPQSDEHIDKSSNVNDVKC